MAKKSSSKNFVEFTEAFKQFSDQVGGTFDPLSTFIPSQFEDFQLPLMFYFFPRSFFRPTEEQRKNILYRMKEEDLASIMIQTDVPYKRHILKFVAMCTPEESGMVQRPTTTVHCALKAKTIAYLRVSRRSDSLFYGPTGQTSFGHLAPELRNDFLEKYFVPKAMRRMIDSRPAETYFCPFSGVELNGLYNLRSSSVKLGKQFSEHLKIGTCLSQVQGLEVLDLGLLCFIFGDEYGLCIRAHVEKDPMQLYLLYQLCARTIDLLETSGLI